MDWLFLAGLGMVWVVCFFPRRSLRSPAETIREFGRGMGALEETGRIEGRYIMAPRKGRPLLGPRERARARVRARRRRVLTILSESTALTILMGMFPPLRGMLYASGVLASLLVLYVWLLLHLKQTQLERDRRMHDAIDAAVQTTRRRPVAAPQAAQAGLAGNGHERFAAGVGSRMARPVYKGLGVLGEGDVVHVRVRSAREWQLA
jgi:hypothetical protein